MKSRATKFPFAVYEKCSCANNCNNLKPSALRCRAKVHYWRDPLHVYQCSLNPTVMVPVGGKDLLFCRPHAKMAKAANDGSDLILTEDGIVSVMRQRMAILTEAGDAMGKELMRLNPESAALALWDVLRGKERDNYYDDPREWHSK